MRMSLLALLAALALAGCTTISPEERRAADEEKCRDYGFRQGTDAFATCLQRIDLSREADRRARHFEDPFPQRPAIVYRPVVVRD